jgi:signal transduction histidine kinase/ActR/RegA family two-component response regulator
MTAPAGLAWYEQRRAVRLFVGAVIAAGAVTLVVLFPISYPRPLLFAALLVLACVTSSWKVNLPIALSSGSTLSVSYAADLMALLTLGPRHALLIAVAGVWTQCTYKVRRPYPIYRSVFSAAAEALTMAATGAAYAWLGGPAAPRELVPLAEPLVGAVATYFLVNTGLVAGAIALSSRRTLWEVWRDDFLWSGSSFMVAGSAGAAAAVIVNRGQHWIAVVLFAPIYLTYRTYRIFVGRLEDEQRHAAETAKLHAEAVDALSQARAAERALATEKARLAEALAEMTRLQQIRNQLLEREQSARAAAEQANRLKDQFLAIVSHELRTPLNAVLGWADMLRRGTLDEAKRARASHAIYDGARRQSQLIDDLLDVARIMSGKLRLSRAPVDMHDIIRAAIEVVQPASDAKRIQILVNAEQSVGALYADGARLQQIVWNLLSNAIKFTPDGGAVHVSLRRTSHLVELSVRDTGPGIPADFLGSVFEPFRQADASTTRTHGGLGLGLAIVKHLVDAHGGTVVADSTDGHGATFTVRLPIVAVYSGRLDRSPGGPFTGDAPDDPATSLEGIRVLVVDDDDDNREVVATSLETYRAATLQASSVAQAIEILQRDRVHVLLTDVAMPSEDGYALIRRLRASENGLAASTPAIALTAFARPEDRHHALQAGFQLHLAKPIDARSLVAAIASIARAGVDVT